MKGAPSLTPSCARVRPSSANAPWASPGTYTVRLTVNGASYSQPLTLKLDPRVKTSAMDLATLYKLTDEMYFGAVNLRALADKAKALQAQLENRAGLDLRELVRALG